MWDLPRSGIVPVSPALAGRFLTTGPPEKSSRGVVNKTRASTCHEDDGQAEVALKPNSPNHHKRWQRKWRGNESEGVCIPTLIDLAAGLMVSAETPLLPSLWFPLLLCNLGASELDRWAGLHSTSCPCQVTGPPAWGKSSFCELCPTHLKMCIILQGHSTSYYECQNTC